MRDIAELMLGKIKDVPYAYRIWYNSQGASVEIILENDLSVHVVKLLENNLTATVEEFSLDELSWQNESADLLMEHNGPSVKSADELAKLIFLLV